MDSRSQLVLAVLDQARTDPAAPALSWRGGQTRYDELAAMTRSAAGAIAELPSGPVGVVAKKTPETTAIVLGCLAAGRRPLLPTPTLPNPVLVALHERAECVAVVAAATTGTTNAARLATRIVDVHLDADQLLAIAQDAISLPLRTSGATGTRGSCRRRTRRRPVRAVGRRKFDLAPPILDSFTSQGTHVVKALPRTSTGKVDRKHITATMELVSQLDNTAVITRYIVDEFLPDIGVGDLPEDYDLFAGGVIDSLALLKVIDWLDTRFQLRLDDVELVPDNFRTVHDINIFINTAGAQP